MIKIFKKINWFLEKQHKTKYSYLRWTIICSTMKKISKTLLLFLVLFTSTNPEMFSIYKIKIASKDTSLIQKYLTEGNSYLHKQPDSAHFFYKKAMTIATSSEQSNTLAKIHQKLGTLQRSLSNYDSSKQHFVSALKLYQKLNDSLGIAKAKNNLGTIDFFKGNYKEALQIYHQAINLFKNLNYTKGIADCRNNMGIIHWKQKNYELAKKYYKEAAKSYEKLGNKRMEGFALNNLGIIFGEQNEYIQSLEYYKKATAIFEEIGFMQAIKRSYQNMGIVHKNLGNYQKAIDYYKKSLEISERLGDKEMIASNYINMAELYNTMADSSAYTKRQRNYFMQKAVENGEKAIQKAKQIGAVPLINNTARSMLNIYKKTGNSDKALRAAETYIETQDSLFNKEKTKTIEKLEAEYQAEKKQLRIDKLEKEKTLQKEKMLRQRYLIVGFIIGFIVIAAFSIIVFRQSRKNKKANELLRRKNEEIQKQKETLSKQTEELSSANATKNKFFSIIAHDLKNPFNQLLGNSQLLLEKWEYTNKNNLKGFVEDIHTATERGYNLLVNLLEWSRAQTGRLKIEPQQLYLNDIIQQTIFLLKPNADQKQIKLKNELKEDFMAYADPNTVTTAIRNLVSNAIKYTENSGEVKIYGTSDNEHVTLYIEDNGIGISEKEHHKIFSIDKEFSKKGTNAEIGTGLGLLLCKEFIEKNGGTINFTSKEGEGTTFYFTLKKGEKMTKEIL
jgi:signal transduction histidine kinase